MNFYCPPVWIVVCLLALAQILPAVAQSTNEPAHPILTISGSSSGASSVTNIAESAYTNNFVPHTPPRGSAQGFAPAVVSGDTGWSWSTSTPNQITSTPSGIVFPSTNSAYPVQTQAVTVFLTTATNNLTKTVNAISYKKAGSSTTKSMVFNLIDYNKLVQLRSDFNKLAPAYIGSGGTPSTRNDNYARRIAIALLDWARWHPSYYLTAINSPTYINVTSNYLATTGGFGPQRASDHNGLAHEWQDDELLAFDAIYNSVVLTNMNTEFGFNVRQYICDNLFFDEGDFLVNHIPIDIAIQSNLSGPYAVLPQVARVLNRPDYILWMDVYLDATVRQKIRRDGALEEGEGYSIGYLNSNQDAAQNTHDYFLTRAAATSQFLAISNRATIFNTTFTYGQGQWNTISLPNGQLPSFGDTPFNNYFSSHSAGNSALLPAYGTLALGAGTGSQAVQVNQNFTGNNNHMRADMSAFVLWAFNEEYLGNIRYYNGAIGRNFGEQMLAYNTVQIDRVNLTPYADADTYGNGDLTLYEPGNNGLALTEIDGQRAYSSKASRFQRLLLLNTVDLAKPYIVDVFRVTGGTTHDYMFHGAIRWDQNGQCSFPLVTNNNLYPMLEGGETWDLATDTPYYGFWRNVSSNAAPGNFQITYSDTSRSAGRDTRLWMTAEPNTYNVYLGTTPVPARDNTVPTNFFNSLGLTRPSTIIRHRIASGTLQDLFVSVVEPFNVGVTNIVSVTRLPMGGTTNESVGLKITFKDGRVDTCIVNLRNPQIAGATGGSTTVATADGQYSLTGRVGLQVDRTGGDSRVVTMNATDFKFAGRGLSTPTNTYFSGLIAGETRRINGDSNDAFTTASPLPLGTALRNKWLSFTHGALSGSGTTGVSEMFKIDQVVFTNGLYNICFTNDHMLEITNGTTSVEQVAPLRTFTTSNSFEIALGAAAQQISTITDRTIPPNGTSGPLGFSFGNLGAIAGTLLQVAAASTNQTLVPNGNLVIGGSGTNRTITITPVLGQTGSSLITVSVTDGLWTNSRSFNVTVQSFGLTASPNSQTILSGGSASFTATVTATNGFTNTVTFGLSGLPPNLGASFSPTAINGAGSSTLNITASNSISPGTYLLSLTATSGGLSSTGSVTLIVTNIVASPGTLVWIGTNNWSVPLNWTNLIGGGNGPPGAVNDVVFTNFATAIVSNLVNNIVDSDVTISSLAFNHTNGFHTTQILAGKTLTISGGKGLVVGTETDNGSAQSVFATVSGAGMLNVSNGNADLVVRQGSVSSGGALRATLDLSGLETFQATVKQVQLGSFGANPRLSGKLYLARTNIITASGPAPAIVLGGHSGGSANGGNGSFLYLGGVNEIFADGISVATEKQGGCSMLFNPAFENPTAYFRAADGGGRVASWLIGDSESQGGTVNATGTNDFTGGTVYVLANTMTLGKSSTSGSGNGNPSGTLTFEAGTIDVNTLQIGYQSSGGPLGNIATGIFNVNGTAMLVVNSSVELGHIPVGGTNATKGTLNINGGVVVATNMFGGGGTSLVNLNSGILDLQGGGVTNVSTLNIGLSGMASEARLINAAFVQSPNAVNISSNGLIFGNLIVTAPSLLLNGGVAPGGDGTGLITNNGAAVFGAGGRYLFDMADAVGQPGTNWDFIFISGGLNIQASSTNPFVVKLRSIDGSLNDAVPGAADFGSGSSQSWLIATASGGITNFSADKFVVDAGAFANDLAGGKFFVQTNGNSLLLAFESLPSPPVIGNVTLGGVNFVVSGTGGAAGGKYYVLSSTNLALPLAGWARVATNYFDAAGNFTFTNDVSSGGSQKFYLLQLP